MKIETILFKISCIATNSEREIHTAGCAWFLSSSIAALLASLTIGSIVNGSLLFRFDILKLIKIFNWGNIIGLFSICLVK